MKKHNEIITEIDNILDILCPDLNIKMYNKLDNPTTLQGISDLYPSICINITHKKWLEHQYPEALIREQVLESLIKTHKQLRKEIERIMYGNR